jgi:hypothetical protein
VGLGGGWGGVEVGGGVGAGVGVALGAGVGVAVGAGLGLVGSVGEAPVEVKRNAGRAPVAGAAFLAGRRK